MNGYCFLGSRPERQPRAQMRADRQSVLVLPGGCHHFWLVDSDTGRVYANPREEVLQRTAEPSLPYPWAGLAFFGFIVSGGKASVRTARTNAAPWSVFENYKTDQRCGQPTFVSPGFSRIGSCFLMKGVNRFLFFFSTAGGGGSPLFLTAQLKRTEQLTPCFPKELEARLPSSSFPASHRCPTDNPRPCGFLRMKR